ncbi:MAG TPA: glutamine--fructose-6-phosphate transaminase (isomerizing) [Dehalococcoidia bacterium]|nr:glutamine--fructose-6-phosphate transaminase (isomerizing) [Dehalococcoidia bacterium]
MCGIIGYTGRRPAGPIVIDGLRRLEYRGYDSAGIALFDSEHELFVAKAAGKLDNLDARIEGTLPPAVAGIGHTRWATHGEATDANAHPHLDPSGRVAVIHNGIVENFETLRARFRDRGDDFRSETDTEVVAHLIAEHLADGVDLAEALRLTTLALEGAQAIVAVTPEEPSRLVAARVGNAGGVVIGHGDEESFIASDLAALLPHTRRVTFLDPGEIADVRADGVTFIDSEGRTIEKPVELQPYDPVAAVKGRYKHFMLKEIHQQPETALDAIRGRYLLDPPHVELDDFPLTEEQVRDIRRVIIVAMGTSMHAALVGRHYMERLARIPTEVDNAAEFRYREPVIDKHTLVVSISQAGETVDTLWAMEEARAAGCPQITICNTPGSQSTRIADAALSMRAGPEIAVASTKTMIGSMIALHALALRMGSINDALDPSLEAAQVEAALHAPTAIGQALLLEPQLEEIAGHYAQFDNFLFLGRGLSLPIALEGALKLKEVSYIHAEGYPAGEMKHGPIALIDEQVPTVALALDDGLRDKMRSNIEQIRARRGLVVAIVSDGDRSLDGVADEVVELPSIDPLLSPLVSVVPMQLLAYHVAVERGCDVDQPRNLAKTVTVE